MALGHSPQIVRDGLVLHLDAANPKSYTGSGNLSTDLSGEKNNGTLINNTSFSSDNLGSFLFDGASDFINLSRIDITTEITQIAFIKILGYRSRGTIMTDVNSYYFQSDNGYISVYTYPSAGGNSAYDTSNTLLSLNDWYQVAFTENSNGLRSVYINGALDFSIQREVGIQTSSGDVRIGSEGSSRNFYGYISQVFLYNRSLSSLEIKQNFEAYRDRYGI